MKKTKKEILSLIISKTLIFIFVVLLVSAFKSIFKPENSLIGVTSVVLMLVLLQIDLTKHPVRNLFGLILLNLIFGLSAFLVSQSLILGLAINFVVMMFIGYFFSYELQKPVNMMIGLHYILMIVTPITIYELPLRLLSLIAGAFMIMSAQLLVNKNKLLKSRNTIFKNISTTLLLKIELLKSNKDTEETDKILTSNINNLKSIIFNSGKTNHHLLKCGVNTLNILSCFEKINTILNNMQNSNINTKLLDDIYLLVTDLKNEQFNIDLSLLENKYKKENSSLSSTLNMIDVYDFINVIKILQTEVLKYNKVTSKDVYKNLVLPKEFNKLNIQKKLFSLKSIRVTYGIRLGLLVSLTFFFVHFLNIPFGDWAVYTVFALSQPHYEYTICKSKKRIIGTVIGSLVVAVLFNLVKDPSIRTVILIVTGYLMSYFSDYKNLVIFVTISAIASATINVVDPNLIILDRLFFVILGVGISLLANKFILPHNLKDEEDNLNLIQQSVTKEMIKEVLNSEGHYNSSMIKLLSLIPSLIDLRTDYMKQNGLSMDKSVINENKIMVNNLYHIYLLKQKNIYCNY